MAASSCVLVLLLVHIWIGTLHAVPIGNREAQGWVSCIYWKAKNCPVSVVEGNCLRRSKRLYFLNMSQYFNHAESLALKNIQTLNHLQVK